MLRGARAQEVRDERRCSAGARPGGARRGAGLLLGEPASGEGTAVRGGPAPGGGGVGDGGICEPRRGAPGFLSVGSTFPLCPWTFFSSKPLTVSWPLAGF